MGRYKGPSCKKCRRAREKLFLKGERCYTAKCEIEKRNYPPGIRSIRMPKISEYGRRLIEKQKLRFFYGVSESQMRIYFKSAANRKGVTGSNLLSLFERRMDNIIYRMNFARSRKEARQMVRHGHFKLNNRNHDIPSTILGVGDIVELRPGSEDNFKTRYEVVKEKQYPTWLKFNATDSSFTIQHEPKRQEIDVPVQEQLIVEYYSK